MSARSLFWSSAALALVGAGSMGGCALFYGYGDYQTTTSATGSGGAGGAGPGTSSTSSSGGGGTAGGSGTAGGGGAPVCPTGGSLTYALTWSNLYASAKDVAVAGVHVDGGNRVSLAATFSGALQIGSSDVKAGPDQGTGMVVAEFTPGGAPIFARSFAAKSAGNVTATALAVDSKGNPYGLGVFDTSVVLDSTTHLVGSGVQNVVVAALSRTDGASLPAASVIGCTPDNGASCTVTADAAWLDSNDKLYLAGTLLGNVSFGASGPSIGDTQQSGYAAVVGGSTVYELKGTPIDQLMTGFVRTSVDGELVFAGTVKGTSYFDVCGAAPAATNRDIALMKYKDVAPKGTAWSCPTSVFVAGGNQDLDALLPTDDGGVFIAGRTDGGLNLGGGDDMLTTPRIFVARLNFGGNLVWSQTIDVTATSPVHLDVTSDGATLILSGGFTGMVTLDSRSYDAGTGHGGLVATFDSANPGTAGFGTAIVPCEDAGDASLIASAQGVDHLVVAGSVSGPAELAGKTVATEAGLYVGALDKKN